MKAKKSIRRVLSVAIVALCCFLIFMQLKANKQEKKAIVELATIKGQYYPVKALRLQAIKPTSTYTTTGFLKSETDLDLISETNGRIIDIFKQKGDYVKQGDVIAKVDDELLAAQLMATKAAYQQLEKEVARFTKLVKENAVTSQKLEEIQLNKETAKAKYISAKRQLENTRIKAPISGYIESDAIEVGQFIGAGYEVCNIIDANSLKLQLEISEHDYSRVRIGQKVKILSSTFPNKIFVGEVSYIGQKAGSGNSFSAEIKLHEQQDVLLKAGMFVTAEMTVAYESKGIFIPRRAVVGSLKDAAVYTISSNNVSVLTQIVTGQVVNGQVEVISGLNDGDLIVVDGNYNIYDKANVKVVNL